MITEDYILRMIRDMGLMICRLLGLKTETPYKPQQFRLQKAGDEPDLSERLKNLADQGEIDRAETLLFEELDFSEPEQFLLALSFYQYLSGFSDARLELCGFSREEILEGLKDCAEKFGVDKSLLDAFHG